MKINKEKFPSPYLTLFYLQVCSWGDKQMLRSITWKDATDLTGCYAFNAAQDGGQCKPCISHVEQVGVLLGCHRNSINFVLLSLFFKCLSNASINCISLWEFNWFQAITLIYRNLEIGWTFCNISEL